MVSWCNYLADIGSPLDRSTIRPMVLRLSGSTPGSHWLRRFLGRHTSEIRFTRAQSLDPKRARSFNRPSVDRYFEKLLDVVVKYDIPFENIYNMDEKGCQLGGGRKQRRRKHIFSKSSKARYRIRDGNLELVTVVECVSANGFALKPYVIFKGQRINSSWLKAEGAAEMQ